MGQIITINFRGDTLYGFDTDEGPVVAVKAITDGMGLAWEPQRQRLQRDPVLSKGTRIMKVPFGRGGAQDVTCLRLSLVHGWLFTVESTRVKDPDVQKRVIAYQEECFDVLAAHFLTKPPGSRTEAMPSEGIDRDAEPSSLKCVAEARLTWNQVVAREVWMAKGLIRTPSMFQMPSQSDLFTYSAMLRADVTATEVPNARE